MSSSAPSPDEILNKQTVKWGTIQDVVGQGLRGFVYAGFLFVISVLTGFIRIIQNYLRALAGGVGDSMANFLGGIAHMIQVGAIQTANNFLLPGPFGFVEALGWTFAGLVMLGWMQDYFDMDIFPIPGLAIIPFYGEEQDGDE